MTMQSRSPSFMRFVRSRPISLHCNQRPGRASVHINGDIGIVTILHERMHRIDRFRDVFT